MNGSLQRPGSAIHGFVMQHARENEEVLSMFLLLPPGSRQSCAAPLRRRLMKVLNTLRNQFAKLAIFFGLAFTMTLPAFGQTVTGSIYGTVADSTGATISQANVTVTNTDTGQTLSAQSNNNGAF